MNFALSYRVNGHSTFIAHGLVYVSSFTYFPFPVAVTSRFRRSERIYIGNLRYIVFHCTHACLTEPTLNIHWAFPSRVIVFRLC